MIKTKVQKVLSEGKIEVSGIENLWVEVTGGTKDTNCDLPQFTKMYKGLSMAPEDMSEKKLAVYTLYFVGLSSAMDAIDPAVYFDNEWFVEKN